MLGTQRAVEGEARSTVDAIADVVLASWGAWELPGAAPRRLDWVISSRSYVQKAVVTFVHPSTGRLVAIAKVANAQSAAWIVETEHRNLVEVRDSLREEPTLRDALPVPYLLRSDETQCVLLESALDGSPSFGVRLTRSTFVPTPHLDECFEWLVGFHEYSRTRARMRQHGDYTLSNTLRLRNGALAVLDWENAGDAYPPCYDLFSLASSAAFQAFEATGRRGSLSEAFASVYGSPSPLSERVAEYLRSYSQRMGLDPSKAREWLMDFFTVKGERMRALYGTRNTYARAWATLGEQAKTAVPAFLNGET